MQNLNGEWRFVQLRAAQLFEEGDTQGALQLLDGLHAEQAKRFDVAAEAEKNEQKENC